MKDLLWIFLLFVLCAALDTVDSYREERCFKSGGTWSAGCTSGRCHWGHK